MAVLRVVKVEPKKSKRAQNIVIAGISGLLLFYAFCTVLYVNTDGPKTSSLPISRVKVVGQTAVVDNGGGSGVLLATTEAAYREISKARLAGDQTGIFEVMAGGRAFPVDCKTKVLVLETGFSLTKVRIVEGPHQGKAGWVPVEFVK